jgi:hypothetical protein
MQSSGDAVTATWTPWWCACGSPAPRSRGFHSCFYARWPRRLAGGNSERRCRRGESTGAPGEARRARRQAPRRARRRAHRQARRRVWRRARRREGAPPGAAEGSLQDATVSLFKQAGFLQLDLVPATSRDRRRRDRVHAHPPPGGPRTWSTWLIDLAVRASTGSWGGTWSRWRTRVLEAASRPVRWVVRCPRTRDPSVADLEASDRHRGGGADGAVLEEKRGDGRGRVLVGRTEVKPRTSRTRSWSSRRRGFVARQRAEDRARGAAPPPPG